MPHPSRKTRMPERRFSCFRPDMPGFQRDGRHRRRQFRRYRRRHSDRRSELPRSRTPTRFHPEGHGVHQICRSSIHVWRRRFRVLEIRALAARWLISPRPYRPPTISSVSVRDSGPGCPFISPNGGTTLHVQRRFCGSAYWLSPSPSSEQRVRCAATLWAASCER